MTVPTVASVVAGAIERNLRSGSPSIAQSVKSLITASGVTPSAQPPVETARLSAAVSLQSQVAGLRSASLGLAQTSAMVETAASGTSSVGRILGRLQDLAQRASGSVDDATRRSLDVEFRSLRSEINRTVAALQFNGRLLLDGSVKAADLGLEGPDENLGIPDLRAEALLGDDALSIADAKNAEKSLAALKSAQQFVTQTAEALAAFQAALETGAATVETAIQNQEAARSTLGGDDLDALAALLGAGQALSDNPAASVLAQARRIPPSMIALLAE